MSTLELVTGGVHRSQWKLHVHCITYTRLYCKWEYAGVSDRWCTPYMSAVAREKALTM